MARHFIFQAAFAGKAALFGEIQVVFVLAEKLEI